MLVVDDHQMVAEGLADGDPELPGASRSVTCVHSGAEARASGRRAPARRRGRGPAPPGRRRRAARPPAPGSRARRRGPVLISASFTPESLDDAVAAGITALASKLASGEELVQVVRAAAAGTAYVSSDVMPLLADCAICIAAVRRCSVREREVIQALADGSNVPTIADAPAPEPAHRAQPHPPVDAEARCPAPARRGARRGPGRDDRDALVSVADDEPFDRWRDRRLPRRGRRTPSCSEGSSAAPGCPARSPRPAPRA